MTRAFLRRLFRVVLRLFFRKIELVGVENVPTEGGVIFAVNHPNGLVDPLFLLAYLPRPISFLAKAPLFRMPVISFFVRQLRSIPVYRKQDQLDPKKNAETFDAARRLLNEEGAIAIFPEGTTHSDPRLKPLKTGAARIALGANCETERGLPIVPTGINYTAKTTFRSGVVVTFGHPLLSGRCAFDERGEPDREAVRVLTEKIDAALRSVTLEADSHAALELVRAAEDIFSSAGPEELAQELELQRRLVDGYSRAKTLMPERVARLEAHVSRFAAELADSRVTAHELDHTRSPGRSVGRLAGILAALLVVLPVPLFGTAVHLPAYLATDALAKLFARGEQEMVGTLKVIAGALLYLSTWLAIAAIADHFFGKSVAVIVLLAMPFVAVVTVWFWEQIDEAGGLVRALMHGAFRRYSYRRLLEERRSIRMEIAAIAEELERIG
jgi:1-acyl-sn-glycerol-3-phosphate acyltransferase